jgi:hypothetical protein
MGYAALTRVRYRDITTIDAAYFASADKTKLFRITCEEITEADLPIEEKEVFDEIELEEED